MIKLGWLTQEMLDKLADKIQSGEIVFDPAYTIDENGRMVIVEVSLVHRAMMANRNL